MVEPNPFDEIILVIRRLIVAVVVLYLAAIGITSYFWVNASHQRHDIVVVTKQLNRAACATRRQFDHRIKRGKEFLALHPNGIPGISRAVILASIRDDQDNRAALASVKCD